ncbi:MAG: hypothetical protein SVW57_08415 [Thermodesulfobacteriota bacterium]|nr:hypothetical protein [Thermodesulfobacteriota bacterium]
MVEAVSRLVLEAPKEKSRILAQVGEGVALVQVAQSKTRALERAGEAKNECKVCTH